MSQHKDRQQSELPCELRTLQVLGLVGAAPFGLWEEAVTSSIPGDLELQTVLCSCDPS